MSVFDFVGDAVGNVTSGARSFLGDAQKFFEKVGNLGAPEIGPGLSDKWGFIHDNPLVKLAGSPILSAAQMAIGGMKLTTGSGDPEDGGQLSASHDEMEAAGEVLVYADPVADRWDGSASAAYANKNSAHRHQVFDIATADKEIRDIIAEEATQVARARQELDDISNFLADFDTATSWMTFVPGAAALKVQLDTGCALTNLLAAADVISGLVSDTWDNADKIDAAAARYQRASDMPLLGGTECAPFVDERQAGHNPPSRTQDDPLPLPDYELPPGFYPPAAPKLAPSAPATAAAPATAPGAVTPPRVPPTVNAPSPPAPAPAPRVAAPAPPPTQTAPAVARPSTDVGDRPPLPAKPKPLSAPTVPMTGERT